MRAWDPAPDRHARVNAAILAAITASEEAIVAHGKAVSEAHDVATGVLAEEVGAIVRRLTDEKGRTDDI